MTFKRSIAAALIAASTASYSVAAYQGQVSDKHQTISIELVAQATKALSAGDLDDAQLFFERALVSNPGNVDALIGLGMTYEGKGQTGKGLTYYRYALAVEPNDKTALKAQSLAFLKRDLYDRAEANRDRMKVICQNGCSELDDIQAALETYRANEAAEAQQVAAATNGNSN